MEKQYSVLELLELQARARAIRSQLALEPVTKIELDDSDAEAENSKEADGNHAAGASSVPPQEKSRQKEKDPKDSSKQRSAEPSSKVPAPRPVRLKRNFRQRQAEGYESDENQSIGEKEKTVADAEEPQTSVEKPVEKEKSPAKEAEPASVANDDDVVPIIAEPEVLCISSSDSESDDKSTSSKVKKYINMPVVEKIDRPPTEDELFLLKIKEKSEAKLKSDAAAAKDGKSVDVNNEVSNAEKGKSSNSQPDDMEDGEIVEEDEIFEIAESPERPPVQEKAEETNDTAPEKEKSKTENEQTADQSNDLDKSQDNADDSSSSSSESADEKKSSDSENSDDESDNSDKKSRSLASRNSKKSNVDDDDEDIIDLGKDEDLDFEQLEMNTEARKEPEKVKSPRRTRSKTKSRNSDDSEKCDEPKVRNCQWKQMQSCHSVMEFMRFFVISFQNESWDKRWLRGNKVSKVLATAKLANKVRSKIIEKKSKTVAKSQESVAAEAPKEPEPIVPPNVELGSVEHYKELTKQK